MPRKPNYSFERTQRERAKVAKQEAKREAKTVAKAAPADRETEAADQTPTPVEPREAPSR